MQRENESSELVCDVVVVGGGPAGMFAAIAAAQSGAKVILCEQLDRLGAKILVTGGGRCNLTNTASEDEFIHAFGRQGRFITPAFHKLDVQGLRDLLSKWGLGTCVQDDGKVFPRSQRAGDVRRVLWQECERVGVRLMLGCRIEGVDVQEGAVVGVETSKGYIRASRVVLATGGLSYPKLGATGGGFAVARTLGHRIAEPICALVGLVTQQHWPGKLAGVSVPLARVWIDLPRQPKAGITGDLLFTHKGVSGPAVMDLSGSVSQMLQRKKEVPICVDFSPETTTQEWESRFKVWRTQHGKRTLKRLLSEHVPAALSEALLTQINAPNDVTAAQVTHDQRTALVGFLKACRLTVKGTEGFERAMVTRGGVSLKEVNPQTLESKVVCGLFFAGEVLDLDGPCGGFNLQWAFSSGWLAGSCAGGAELQSD